MRIKTGLLITLVLALVLGLTGVVFAAEANLTIPLNNDTAEEGTDCPATGGPYWHFVISPNNDHSAFITFHLNLGDAATYDTTIFIPNGDQWDNIFLAVPSGKTLTSLEKEGSSAEIYWDGVGTQPDKFQLSHVCGVPKDLTVTKTASPSYKRTFDWTIDKSADKETVFSAGGGESDPVNFTVAVVKDAGTDSDWAVSGTITVHNPNGFAVNGVSLADATPGGTCMVVPATVNVAAKSSATADYNCTFASNPGSGTNTATAAWVDFGSPSTSASGTANYTFGAPTTLVNDSISVTDTNGKTWEFSASGSVSYAMTYNDPAGVCTSHENTATIDQTGASDSATVTDCQGADLTVSKTAVPTFTRTFDWEIDKSADPMKVYSVGGGESDPVNFTVAVTKDAGTDSDWAISGIITVTNPNDWQDVVVDVTDDLCPVTGGEDVTIPAGKSMDFPYSCAVASTATLNTATATWDKDVYHTPNGSASGSAGFAFDTPTTLVNDEIDVTDTNGGSWHFTDSGSVTYPMTYSDPAGTCTSHENTATIEVLGKSASVTVEDCQGADLIVSKTAVPSFDLTYAWNIMKDVDKTYMEVVPGSKATFNYTVSVSHDAGTASNWAISGIITVTNPNDWQSVVVDVTDDLCEVTGGEDATIPAGGSVDFPYSCAVDAAATLNTATATWDAAAYHTPNGSATGSASFAFVTPTTLIDECVDVTDSVFGDLGTVCVGDANPKVFTYSVSYDAPELGTCMEYTNTATFTTKDTGATGSDSEIVKVCAWNARRTPGYWKNHLAIAKEFLPITLGDFSVDATTMVTKVFKAMNCSSTTSQDAVGCLAGHLLAAKLNVANMANPSIQYVIDDADAFLRSIVYIGPSGTYKLTAAQRAYAIRLKNSLDLYNNGK